MNCDTSAWRPHFIDVESSVNHFYLDGPGNVTIGIGHKVIEPSVLPLLLKSTGIRATRADIQADYDAVKALPEGRPASYYDRVCRTRMLEADIFNIWDRDIKAFVQQIEDCVTNLDDVPDLACLVLTDIVFSVGTRGMLEGFPKFMNAFLKHDWKIAALESKRKEYPEYANGVSKERNDWARASLESLIQFQKGGNYDG